MPIINSTHTVFYSSKTTTNLFRSLFLKEVVTKHFAYLLVNLIGKVFGYYLIVLLLLLQSMWNKLIHKFYAVKHFLRKTTALFAQVTKLVKTLFQISCTLFSQLYTHSHSLKHISHCDALVFHNTKHRQAKVKHNYNTVVIVYTQRLKIVHTYF